jgi:hypothetical protein
MSSPAPYSWQTTIALENATMERPNDTSEDEIRRVSRELSGRLELLGLRLDGAERPEELIDITEAIERFEAAVQQRGGDLMMDEGPRGRTAEPDDRHFALPVRHDGEAVMEYLERLSRATDNVRHHARRAD